jgi:hypothetical protein
MHQSIDMNDASIIQGASIVNAVVFCRTFSLVLSTTNAFCCDQVPIAARYEYKGDESADLRSPERRGFLKSFLQRYRKVIVLP